MTEVDPGYLPDAVLLVFLDRRLSSSPLPDVALGLRRGLAPSDDARVVEARNIPAKNHIRVIRTTPSEVTDWLDSCCWGCGSEEIAHRADGRLLCGSCREDLFSEPAADPLHLARHAYWESHALRCCWRCMTRAVDPDDEVGMCPSCRERIGHSAKEGAA